MAEEILIVYATFPNADTARTIVATLVEEGLVACGNLIPNVESIYRWQGTVQAATEVFGIMKTTRSCLIALAERYRALHPYQVAEFLTVSRITSAGSRKPAHRWRPARLGLGRSCASDTEFELATRRRCHSAGDEFLELRNLHFRKQTGGRGPIRAHHRF